MLNNIQVGDKILFKATENNGYLTITEIKSRVSDYEKK